MHFNRKFIGILVTAMLTCEAVAFAYQPQAKPANKEAPAVQVEFITPDELKAKIARNEPVTVVDLRGSNVFADSDTTIKGSVHTQVRKVAHRLREISRDREIITYCACPDDEAAIVGARQLLTKGFKRVRVLKGGWNAWVKAGGQLQPTPKG